MRATAPFPHRFYVLICCFMLSISLEASLKIHLKIDAVDGDSQVENFNGWTDLTGISHGGESSISITSGSIGRFKARPLTLQMKMSAAHPYIAARVASGQSVPEMRIQLVRSTAQGGSVVVDYVFYDVYFSSACTTANEEQEIVSNISFLYSTMEWSVVQVSSNGSDLGFLTISHDELNNTATLVSINGSIPLGNNGGGGSGPSDTDGDGMPNDWETTYGLDPNSDADRDLDLDQDRFSNYLEYLAGTLPNDPTSYLKITQLDLTTAKLEWDSVEGKTYEVQQAIGSLQSADWNTLGEVTAGPGSTSNFTLPNTSTQSKVFYRIRHKP